MGVAEDRLGVRERAALLVLLVEGRELTNAELRDLAGITVDGSCRRRLNDLGLVTSTKVGGAFAHELTDSGAVWCAAELSRARPARSGSLGGALYAVLAGVRRHLDRSGHALADVFAPNVEGQVESAYRALARNGGGGVGLAALRERLAGTPRAEVDRALEVLARRSDVHVRAEPDQKALSQADRDAAIWLGGTARHVLSVEPAR